MNDVFTLKDRFMIGLIFYGLTLPALIYFIPVLIIVILNPFWFRDDAQAAFQRQVERCCQWRNKIISPFYNKHRVFMALKTGNSDDDNSTQVKSSP